MEVEIWIPIKGYEGIYEISNKSRVKSLEKIVIGGRYNCPRLFKEKILSSKNGNVTLCKNQIQKTADVKTLKKITFDDFIPKGDRKQVIINDKVISRRSFIQDLKSKNKDKTSKYVGVHLYKKSNKWRSVIEINKKDVHLGLFESEKEAHEMYLKACKYEYLYKDVPKLFREILKNITNT